MRTPRLVGLITLLVSSLATRAATAGAPVAVAAAEPAITAPGSAAPLPGGVRLERMALANGLEVLLLRDPAAPMVGVFAVIGAGLRHERAGEDGLAHFLEHLLFNGTTTMTQEQLYAAVDRMGGYSNATTRADHTVFQMLVLRRHLEQALAIHAGMLFRSTLPEEKYEKERGIVLEEIAKDAASPNTAVEDAYRAFAWEATALARPVIGSPETLKSIPRASVVEYWRRRYVPANTTVLVVGDVTLAALRPMVEKAFGDIAASPAPLPEAPLAVAARGRELRTLAADLPRTELRLAFAGPDPVHTDAWALDVLATLLNSGPDTSLESALRAAGLAGASGSAGLDRVGGTTAFEVRAHADSGTDPRRLLEAVVAAIEGAAGRASESSLTAVRTRLAVASAFLAEKPHYFGLEKAALLANGGAGLVEGEVAGQAGVGLDELGAATTRWLRGRPFRALVAGRELAAETIDLGGVARGAASAERSASPERRSRTLGNGLRIAVSRNPATAVFAVHVLFRDRAEAEGADGAGLADLLQRLLARRGPDFERELNAIGAVLKTTDDAAIPFDDYYDLPEYGYLRLETTDGFAPRAAAALGQLLGPPTFTDGDLDAARKEQLAVLDKDAKSAAARSARLLAAALHGPQSPLARSPRGDSAVVGAASRDRLLEVSRRWLAPRRLLITVESGLDPDAVLAMLERVLGALPGGAAPAPRAVARPGRPGAPALETLGGKQSYVRLGSAARIPSGERAAFTLAAAILSERLAADIREKRGQAYSIGAGTSFRPAELLDTWSASAGTRPENAEQVEAAMREILARLASEGPSEDEMQLAAARLAGRELMRRLTGIGRAYYAATDLWRGEEPGTSLTVVESLGSVPRERVMAALRRWFQPAGVASAVVK